MKNSKLVFTAVLFSLVGISCAKKTTTEELIVSDGSQTRVGLAGTGQLCEVFSGVGTNLNGMGYVRSLSLDASGTYSYSVYFSDNTGCVTSQNSGGNNIATYSQTGTFAVGGSAGTPATATKITFTPTSNSMIIRPSNSVAVDLRDYFNTCTSSPGFSTGATTSTRDFQDFICLANSAHNFPNPPLSGSIYSNIGYNDGASAFSSGSRDNIWSPGVLGGTTFATLYSETWGTWQ